MSGTTRTMVNDPSDIVLPGLGGVTIGGLIAWLLKGLGGRSLAALDETLKSLRSAVEELHKEVRHLRETDIMQAKDIGALQQEVKSLKERVDGMGNYWRQEFREAMRKKAGPR